MEPSISFAELLTWIGHETATYEQWFAGQPAEVWSLAVGTGHTATIRDLLYHVFIVDLRYGQRLHGLPVSTYEAEAITEIPALFALARRGQILLRRALDERVDLAQIIEFHTQTAGTLRASGRKILAHTLSHHVRHLAQVAMAVRQHGHPTDWVHDLLMSNALD